MINYTNTYAQQIYLLLVPLLGDNMARSILKFNSYKLGKTEDLLSENDIEIMAMEINKGLIPFLGSDGASIVSKKIIKIKST